MYHPVLEDAVDAHEFVELHNPTAQALSLTGARLTGGIEFSFPDGMLIAAGAYLVVAKDKPALDALYPQAASLSVGGYDGQLGNGGDTIRLTAANGGIADAVTYDDGFPWPAAADALGVGQRWLPQELLPLEKHLHQGYSLERINFTGNSNDPASWSSSRLPIPTPGEPNSNASETIPPLVRGLSALGSVSQARVIGPAEEVVVTAEFDQVAGLQNVAVEWYVDAIGLRDEPTVKTPMLADPSAPLKFTATLPAHPENSVVRYRVVADDASGAHMFSPREREPKAWHGFFVTPQLQSTSRVYDLFVEPDDWVALWDNIKQGRELDCKPNPSWNDTVAATFVFEGELIDVQVRYQGSRYGRDDGILDAIEDPTEPVPPGRNVMEPWPEPLSIRVAFPRYHRFEGRDVVTLNKLYQGCPGLSAGLGFNLFKQAGLPTPELRYARLQVNGAYYNYTLEIERPGERMLERWQQARAASGIPAEPLGELYKSAGANKDVGPWGAGDGSVLGVHCGYSATERYGYTYDLKTNEWVGPAPVQKLIEDMDAARAAGPEATRAFVEKNFDLGLTLSYLALRNWAGPWDDIYQNYFLYRNPATAKWIITPWDLDRQFAQAMPSDSLFLGEEGASTRAPNLFKDTILGAFRNEYWARVKELNGDLLLPEKLAAILHEHFNSADFAEAQLSPHGLACDAQKALSDMLAWTAARHTHVAMVTAGPPPPPGPPESPEPPKQ